MRFGIFLLLFLGWTASALILSSVLKRLRPHSPVRASIGKKFLPFIFFQLALFSAAYGGALTLGIFLSLLGMLLLVEYFGVSEGSLAKKWLVFPILFTPLFFSFFYLGLFRSRTGDSLFLAKVFLLVAIFDSFSQILGETIQGRKIFPALSPNKTLSGLFGGLLFVLVGLLSFWQFEAIGGFSMKRLIAESGFAFCLGISAFLGDALASGVKRYLGIKDFSSWLGASGGLLDRVDSLVFTGPVLWVFT